MKKNLCKGFIGSNKMKRTFLVALVCSGCLMAPTHLFAQAPAAQNPPSNITQNPPATPPKPAEANPFPEDTTSVPVMPSRDTPALPPGASNGAENIHVPLPSADLDPVRSPDDPSPDAESASDSGSSDSSSGLGRVLPGPDDDSQPQGRHRKMAVPAPEHHETTAEDIEVGKYEMDNHNWKAALSRFESAMVLAPDEPEVYWGLAESERHLGNFAEARTYYQKVAEYDPDSKHGQEAMKALKEPEIANAKAAAPAPPAK
jgi:Tetratricopeptide repeat